MSAMENHQELRDLAVLYTLGALDSDPAHDEELRRIEAHLSECEECRREVAMAQAGTAMLAQSAAEAPPPELKRRLMAAVARTSPRRARPRYAPWLAVAATIALLIAVAAWLRPHVSPTPGPVAIHLTGVSSPAVGVVRTGGGYAMTVQVEHLSQLPPGKVYQLWSIEPGAKPAPGPTFNVGRDGKANIEMRAAPEKGLVIAVTVEPAGGSTAPTTTPFLAGKLE